MNRIQSIQGQTKYSPEPHTVIAIDGVALDELFNQAQPDRNILGMIPTLLDALGNPAERAFVWDRFLPPKGSSTNAPILMCPDDCDLWCAVVIAEVQAIDSKVWWHRVGIDASEPDDHPNSVGTDVDWIPQLGPYCFDRSDYLRCMATFREQPA